MRAATGSQAPPSAATLSRYVKDAARRFGERGGAVDTLDAFGDHAGRLIYPDRGRQRRLAATTRTHDRCCCHATGGRTWNNPGPPESCPIDAGHPAPPDESAMRLPPPNQAKTPTGTACAAKKGVLYFNNLHSRAHAFYGQLSGQISAANDESRPGDGRCRQ